MRLFGLLLPVAVFAQISIEGGYIASTEASVARPAIFAGPDSATRIFSHWESPILLDDPYSRVTRVNRPSDSIRIRAVYRDAPAWQPVREQINGVDAVYHIPPNPLALIVKFHGAGGSAIAQFRDAQQTFDPDAAADGFAILALDSADRVSRQWNTALTIEQNPDYRNVRAMLGRLRERGLIGADLPLVGVGTSNGGAMVSRAAPVLGFAASAIFIAGGNANVMRQTSVPAIWCLAEFDSNIGPAGNAQGRSNYTSYLERNIPAAFSMLGRTPVPPERLAAIPDMTDAAARELHAFLLSSGVLDERWYVRRGASSGARLPAAFRAFEGQVADLLQVAAAEHAFHYEPSHRVRQFFLARLGLGRSLTVSSAAAETRGRLAPGSFGSAFGYPIGVDPAGAIAAELPLDLAGVRGFYRDSSGRETPLPMAFVSPGQANFLLPASIAPGRGTVSFTHASSLTSSGPVTVEPRVPTLFAMAPTGVAAAQILRVLPSGERRTEDAFAYDAVSRAFVTRPIAFGAGEQLVATFYGTGLGAGASAANTELLIDGMTTPLLYAGPQGGFAGLDQLNVTLPSSLAGRGLAGFSIRAGAETSNRVVMEFRQ